MGTTKIKQIILIALNILVLCLIIYIVNKYFRSTDIYENQNSTEIILNGFLHKNGEIVFDESINNLPIKPIQKIIYGKESDRVQVKIVDNSKHYFNFGTVKISLSDLKIKNFDKIAQKSYAIHGVFLSSESKNNNDLLYSVSNISPTGIWTIEIILPKGVLKTNIWQTILFWSANYSVIWLIISVLLLFVAMCTILYLLWKRHQLEKIPRDKTLTKAPPSDLSPATLTILEKKRAAQRAVAAGILHLAVRGYLTIVKKKSGFLVAKNREPNNLSGIDQELYELLIGKWFAKSPKEIGLENNKTLFNQAAGEIHEHLYNDLISRKLFIDDPWLSTHKTRLFGILLFMISLIYFFVSLYILPYPPFASLIWISMIFISIIIIRIAVFMPLRSRAGVNERKYWHIFKNYLSENSKASIDNDPPMDMYLPYAIALSCENAWILRFAQTQYRVPLWYVGPSITVEDIAKDIVQFVKEFSKIIDSGVPPEMI